MPSSTNLTFSKYTQILEIEFRYTKQSLLACSRNLLYSSADDNVDSDTNPRILAIFDDLMILSYEDSLLNFVGFTTATCSSSTVGQKTLAIENAVTSLDLSEIDNLHSAADDFVSDQSIDLTFTSDSSYSKSTTNTTTTTIEFQTQKQMDTIKMIIDGAIGHCKRKIKKRISRSRQFVATTTALSDASLLHKKSSFFFASASDSNATLYRRVSNLNIQARRPVRSITPSLMSFLLPNASFTSSTSPSTTAESPFTLSTSATAVAVSPSFNTWIPDSEASECMVCHAAKFSLTVRRHHCRSCGRIICSSCSVFIENCSNESASGNGSAEECTSTSLVRVCLDCNAEILAMESD